MSRETSKSPSEIRIVIPEDLPVDELLRPPVFSLSDTITTSIAPLDEEERLLEKDNTGDKKKVRKSIDDTKGRRRDTATSFSNFLHRFTRSEKDDKPKTIITEEERPIERPDKLDFPEAGDKDWLPLRDLQTDQFRTAIDMGNEYGMPMYEWKPDTLEEVLVEESVSGYTDLLQLSYEDPQEDTTMEQSLISILEEFRSDKMKSFTNEQLSAMRLAKNEHESITNLHLSICESAPESVSNLPQLYDELSHKLYKMHSKLSDLVVPPFPT